MKYFVVLFIYDQLSHADYHYSRKSGTDLVMRWDHEREAHVAKIPLEQWRKDKFNEANILLDNHLPVPIFFDIEMVEAPVEAKPRLKTRHARRTPVAKAKPKAKPVAPDLTPAFA